jgi:NTE family protein
VDPIPRLRPFPLAVLVLTMTAGCAAPIQRAAVRPPPPEATEAPPPRSSARPLVGFAFGGGSARGIAHVGVIRWLEEHRVPVDLAAGTSMGGLVGGAFASGMDARELEAFILSLDWDQLFGSSGFATKNIRRKTDARAYPSRLEFGLRGGIVPPTALNNGQQVELMLGRIAAPYFDLRDFDDLPTPFRAVAVDLLTAQAVVLRRGSLADAMRATMSLPLIFPPVDSDGQVLIDGGAMNNIPADIVKEMGASRVVAVNVGDLSDREGVSYTMLGVVGSSLDAMMRASTRRALASADVVVNVPLAEYGSLDWRRATSLIEDGYRAAEQARDQLLPLAVSPEEYEKWRVERQGRRRTELPVATFVELEGIGSNDTRRLESLLARHVGAPLDVAAMEADLAVVSGLDRYETVTWKLIRDDARGIGLRVRGRLKTHAPPFLMLGLNLENTTSSDFRITTTARYLTFDIVGSGSELRVDGTIGSDPGAAIELYRPLGSSLFFVAPYAGIGRVTFNLIQDEAVVARYGQTISRAGANLGVNLGAFSDIRAGAYVGRTTASIQVGDPEFPELSGKETGAELMWRLDTQDAPVVPAGGVRSEVRLSRIFDRPDVRVNEEPVPFDGTLTQFSATGSQFWSLGQEQRVFVYGGLGATFDGTPLPTEQFGLGSPFRLGAYDAGELRGSHYYVVSAGYLRRTGRLPEFMGGPVFAAGWVENGDAFEKWEDAGSRTNAGAGLVMDTLVGPVLLAGSWSFDGRWRTYVGIGRMFK